MIYTVANIGYLLLADSDSSTSFSKPKTSIKSGHKQQQQQLQEQLQFLYVLCSDQKRHIEYLKTRVGQLESSIDQKEVKEV